MQPKDRSSNILHEGDKLPIVGEDCVFTWMVAMIDKQAWTANPIGLFLTK